MLQALENTLIEAVQWKAKLVILKTEFEKISDDVEKLAWVNGLDTNPNNPNNPNNSTTNDPCVQRRRCR